MAETEFEKWLAMKNGKRKKQPGRGKRQESSPKESRASVSKLAKQPMLDPKESVKHQTVKPKLKLEESTTVSQDLNITSPIETSSGTAQTSAKNAMKRLRAQRRREIRRKEDISKK